MKGGMLVMASWWWWLLMFLLHQKLDLCSSINPEGRALWRFRERVEIDPYGALSNWNSEEDDGGDPCSWFGVECEGGRVVALNLKDLCLRGTLAPELGKLIHLKYLTLHNNSFYGVIPKEMGELQNLELLDLGHNNLSGPLPYHLGNILSVEVLILRNNRFLGSVSHELYEINMLSDIQVDDSILCRQVTRNIENSTIRRLLQTDRTRDHTKKNGRKQLRVSASAPSPSPILPPSPSPSPSLSHSPSTAPSPASNILTPQPSPSPSPSYFLVPKLRPLTIAHPPSTSIAAPPSLSFPSTSPYVSTSPTSSGGHTQLIYMSVGLGACSLVILSTVLFLWCRGNKVVTVRPWTTGLSGQLQKAFVTGVPALKRSELETACEDFSNIIGSVSDCMLYKGTLSSGVEIAVISTNITSAKDWSKHSETQFRKKIATLSKINHKNFVNLLGYCGEVEPFTRMMVFEYAPNGTLFEHLHIKEAEHLDWASRLRIAMGIAYCLEHMHQLKPPVIMRNLDSTTIYLTDDYAAKVSELEFWSEKTVSETVSTDSGLLNIQTPNLDGIVYKYGVLLLEIISGRLANSEENGPLVDWASDYLTGVKPVKDMIDPTLKSFCEGDVNAISEVIRSCFNPDLKMRPTMKDLSSRLREITAVAPDGATPKLSPLWWAELEILSTEAS